MLGKQCRNYLILVYRLCSDVVHDVQERNNVTKACYVAAISKSALSWVLAMVLRSSNISVNTNTGNASSLSLSQATLG
jgi:hypothetical protein